MTITEFALSATNSDPRAITSGPDGSLWFTEGDGRGGPTKIGRITTVGVITEFAQLGGPAGHQPFSIAAGPDGNLWFGECCNSNFGRITTAGVITEFTIPIVDGYPLDIAAGPDGNLWITEVYANKIGRVTTSGLVTEFALPAGSRASRITAGPDGNLWFTDFNSRIGRITTAGVITEFTIPTAASSPSDIAAGPDGNIWFTESNVGKIGRLNGLISSAQTLGVSRSGSGAGTVTSSPAGISCGATCSATFSANTTVTLSAQPASGSTFAGWSGEGCSGSGTCTVTMSQSRSVTATFTASNLTLTVTKNGTGTGTVTSAPLGISCGTTCSATFGPGTTVTLSAQPSSGSTFAGWSGEGCVGTGVCTVTMSQARSVTATFTGSTFPLNVSKDGTGTGSVTSNPPGISCGASCSAGFSASTAVVLSAGAASGSTFVGWSGEGCSGTGTCSVIMNQARNVTATFASAQSHSLTVSRNGPGTGTVTSSPSGIGCGATCSASYPAGTTVTLTAQPGSGSAFSGWSGEGCSGTGTCLVTMSQARAVTATFTGCTPSAPVISTTAPVTTGQPATAYVADHPGSSYAWTITNGVINTGQGSSTITYTALAQGTVSLSVTETNGCGSSSAGTTASAQPPSPGLTITSITPSSGPTTGGTTVSIAGTGFQAGATVQLGGVAATGVSVTGTVITAVSAAHGAGSVDVVVSNPAGASATLTSGFSYTSLESQLTVQSVSPNHGPRTGGTPVVIKGTGFQSGASVSFDTPAYPATSVIVGNSTTITAVTPRHDAGTFGVTVSSGGASATLPPPNAYGFTDVPTRIDGVSPATGYVGSTVTITGVGFTPSNAVKFNNAPVASIAVSADGRTISCLAPQSSGVAIPVTVSNSSTSGYFTYLSGAHGASSLTAVTPSSGQLAGGTSVTITGSGFQSGARVYFGGSQASGVTVVDATRINATVPSIPASRMALAIATGEPQTTNVFVMNPDSGVAGAASAYTYTPPGGGCITNGQTLCLNGNRFSLQVTWRNPYDGGTIGVGTPIQLTADTGYFWFFDAQNTELMVKVLDGRATNGYFWVFYGALSDVEYTLTLTDTQTGAVKSYHNLPRTLGSVADTQAFYTGAARPERAEASVIPDDDHASTGPGRGPSSTNVTAELAAAASSCVPDDLGNCLNGGRFRVTASWRNPYGAGTTGVGHARQLSSDTGYFWFFVDTNVELIVKVLDGRGANGHFWVFYGALSDVEYTVTVTDTQTGVVKTYFNPPQHLGSVADTGAS